MPLFHGTRTNGDLRHTRLKGIIATSRKSVAKQTAAVDLEVLTEPLEKAKVRERGERKQKERKEKHQKKKEKNDKIGNEKACAEVKLPKAPQEERSEVESNKKGEDEAGEFATNKMDAALVSNEVETAELFMYNEVVDHVTDKEQSSKVHTKGKENLDKEKKEKKERKRERRREKKEKKDRKDRKERKERKGREQGAKEKKERPERSERETRFDECVRLEKTRNKEATIPEPGSIEAKAMDSCQKIGCTCSYTLARLHIFRHLVFLYVKCVSVIYHFLLNSYNIHSEYTVNQCRYKYDPHVFSPAARFSGSN